MLTLLFNVSILFLLYQPERTYPFLCLHNLFYTTFSRFPLLYFVSFLSLLINFAQIIFTN